MRHHEETLSTVEPIYVNPNGGLASPLKEKQMMFSLFYFSTVDELLDANKYRLYLEGAKFAALLICPCTGRGVVRTIILSQVKRRRTIE
jgi:hypothetical protein